MKRKEEGGLGIPIVYEREEVVKSIEAGNDWYTCKKKEKNIYTRGEKIHVLPIDDEKFIRTDRNNIKSDNLGELPDF